MSEKCSGNGGVAGYCIFAVSKQKEDQPAYRWRGVSVTGRDWRHNALVTARAFGSQKKSLLASIK